MNKAAQLAQQLEALRGSAAMNAIGAALYFDVFRDAMCLMHEDGSVNFIENQRHGLLTCEVFAAENILKVLHHYRPFKEVFKGNLQ